MTQQEYEESKKKTTTYREQQKEYQRLSKGEDSVYQKEKSEAKQDLEDKKQLLAQTDPKAKKTYTTLEIQVRNSKRDMTNSITILPTLVVRILIYLNPKRHQLGRITAKRV